MPEIPSIVTMLSPFIVGSGAAIALAVWLTLYRVPQPNGARARQMTPAVVGAGLFLAGWLLLALMLAVRDQFHANPRAVLPGMRLGVVILLPLLIGYGLAVGSSKTRALLDHVPQHWLIGVQLYRIIGLVFLWLYGKGLLPAQFAVPAGYGDLFIGLTAPLVAFAMLKQSPGARSLAVIWNLFGILDLVVALSMGVLSAPGPFRHFFTEPTAELLTLFPLVLIPAFAVPLSVLLHLLSLRRLFNTRHHHEHEHQPRGRGAMTAQHKGATS